jgi:4'-phosphopantetheinyl transferase EntD
MSVVIAAILPPGVVAVEAYDDSVPAMLFPAEEAVVAGAVPKRRHEFATGRRCARAALAELGYPPAPLLPGERGAPSWPAGVTGTITHCAGYRAAVVAPSSLIAALGVDAEPDAPLPPGVLEAIARPEELVRLADLRAADDGVRWDRLLFCAKEAVYKAWFPRARRWLGFEDASVTFHPATRGFSAELRVDATVDGVPLTGFDGRYLAGRGLLIAAIATPASS